MFDNTRPAAANAQRVSWHMFDTIPNATAVTFARLAQGDGVSSARVRQWKRAVVRKKTFAGQPPVSISTYL